MPVSPQSRRLDAMCIIARDMLWHYEQERFLRPRLNELAVGSADFDHLLKATVAEAYLRVLRQGGDPVDAHLAAVADGNYCVEKWNRDGKKSRVYVNGPHELERWCKVGEAYADDLHQRFLSMLRA